VHEPGVLHVLACLAPAAAAALTLRAGKYPAERALVRISSLRRGARGTYARVCRAARCELSLPRGGLLVAVAMAGRAPPAAIPASS